ncbi:TBC1 domain family member 12 isoform X1 [Heptranchias perlo]|uniref:TBC1 domain family member 12 isoform X1 n=2 Tax=Heptranchias perlo TaxID=212740 RepID=UPI003559A2D1
MSGMIYLHSNHESCLRGPDTQRAAAVTATATARFHTRTDPALGDVFNGCCSMGEAAKQRDAGGDSAALQPAPPGSPGVVRSESPASSPLAPGGGGGSGSSSSASSLSVSSSSSSSPPREPNTNTPTTTTSTPGPDGLSNREGGSPFAPSPGLRTDDTSGEDTASPDPDSPGPEAEAEPGPADTTVLEFMDVSLNSRNSFNRRQSAPEQLADGLDSPAPTLPSDEGAKPKKLGIADYISRSFFTKKTKEPIPSVFSAPGWKLFGKIPPRENPQKDSKTIQQEYEARTGRMTKISLQSARRRNLEFEPLSTTALILEDRPAHLPAKSAEEAQRHRQEYDEMVAEAKKREMKEAQRRKKMMKERFRQEESIAHAMIIWNTDILPNWESIRNTRKVRELWWQGIPPSVRGKVWSLAVGNELNITHELYEIFLSRAKERWKSFSEIGSENETEEPGASGADREASLELIKLDISRTFPSLFIFQKGGPYHDLLHSILGAYTCYRPDVGYVQGMSFVAAVLILNLEEADAFIAFANLLNKPCQLAFFRVDHGMMLKYFASFEVFFEENLPKLFAHFMKNNLTPDIYLIDWIFTLYSKSLPLDLACRVWDVFCRDGEEFLFRTALGILKLYEDILVQMDFIHIAQFLTKLPEDITSEKLFACITTVQMHGSNKKWTQVFASLMKDNKEVEKNHSPALKS